jgi:hypothetical protein
MMTYSDPPSSLRAQRGNPESVGSKPKPCGYVLCRVLDCRVAYAPRNDGTIKYHPALIGPDFKHRNQPCHNVQAG